jgi:hypothetical protein
VAIESYNMKAIGKLDEGKPHVQFDVAGDGNGVRQPPRHSSTLLIAMHQEEEIVIKAKSFMEGWLKQMGLEMKESKTHITHSLNEVGEKEPGFDFLGFTVRQFPDKQARRGYKLLIKPSGQSQKAT